MYCGQVYANLKISAGLQRRHHSSVSMPHCVQLEATPGSQHGRFEYQNLLMEKSVMGNEPRGHSFPSAATCGQGISPPTVAAEPSSGRPRIQLYRLLLDLIMYCTASVLPATLLHTTAVKHSVTFTFIGPGKHWLEHKFSQICICCIFDHLLHQWLRGHWTYLHFM